MNIFVAAAFYRLLPSSFALIEAALFVCKVASSHCPQQFLTR